MEFGQLKRLKRDPERFDVIELYTALSRDRNYKLGNFEHTADFLQRVGASLKASLESDSLLHGKRVESLFAYVSGALGRCAMVKREDGGDIFSAHPEIQPPDYCVILKDGSRFFIEVKNCNHRNFKSPFSLKKDYVERLEKYAKLNGAPLKIAIYFSAFKRWVLLPIEHFDEQRARYAVTFVTAVARSEMAILGDRTIGTKPPLKVEFIADSKKEAFINKKGQAQFTIADIKFYCASAEIIDQAEKNIAFYLVRYGDWIESDCYSIEEDGKLLGVAFEYNPEEPEEEQGFSFIGTLSSMISTAYSELTVYERKVAALDVKQNPSVFSVEVPEGYKGERLPLWQFELMANPAFKEKMSSITN